MNKMLMLGLIAVVTAALVGGFMVVGGPEYARLEKQDMQRVQDLEQLHLYLQCRSSDQILPATLDAKDYCPNHGRSIPTKDPRTGDPYIYRRLSDTSFEVCATFATKSQMGKSGYPYLALEFEGQVGCRKGVASSYEAQVTPVR